MHVRDVELAVREEGDGTPFVWGHGLLSSIAQEDAAGAFTWPAVDGVRTVRYDARGHGESKATFEDGDYRWRSLAADMLGVLDATAGPDATAVLGGASMGCATALHAAMTAPERVRGLVLVIPPTAWGGRRVQAAMYRVGAELVARAGTGAFARMGRVAPRPAILTGELAAVHEVALEAMARMDRRIVPHVLRGAASSDLPRKPRLRAIAAPALILAWDTDRTHPLETAWELARLLPDATLHVARRPADVVRWPELVGDFLRGR